MSMRWDPLIAAALARELEDRFHRARLRAFHLDGSARRVLLFFRELTLALELHPTAGWLTRLPAADPLPDSLSLASRLIQVRALPDESALVFSLQRVRGRDEGVELVAEWIGNRWNAAVVGYRSRVIRHVLVSREERERSLTVGAPYEPPPSTGREGAGDAGLSRERWQEIVEEAGSEPEERRRALLRTVAYTSSLNVEGLLGDDGWHRWRELMDASRWGAWLLETSRGLQPYPLPLDDGGGSGPATRTESLLEAMVQARSAATDEPARLLLLPGRLVERARDRLRRAEGKARGMQRQLDQARDPEPIRALGDLILARYGQIPQGAETATLTDFEGSPVEVELDPTLPPHENAARYYDEAARIERARTELPSRIERARAEAARWRTIVEGLGSGEVDPGEVARRLGPKTGGRPGTGSEGPTLPYRRFRSSGGLEIRVGRGARKNDDLTFRHSSPDDIWLHTRQAAGAHVILRWNQDDNPPRRDLVEAATLAALNSEARHSGSVPVDWTRRKYVRKPRKAPPGAVVPDRIETLFVEPDPEVAERLKESD